MNKKKYVRTGVVLAVIAAGLLLFRYVGGSVLNDLWNGGADQENFAEIDAEQSSTLIDDGISGSDGTLSPFPTPTSDDTAPPAAS